jgi:hypothetical protein
MASPAPRIALPELQAAAFRAGSGTRGPQRAPLRVSTPEDAAEREAVSAARQVMTMNAPPALARSEGGVIQRQAADETPARIPAASAGGGEPLPGSVRGFMEPRFGHDFGAVRIHTDTQAATLSQGLAARAFTTGSDIYFGNGQYQPETPGGRELIAHELAHTVQQGAAPAAMVQRSADLTLTPQPGPAIQREGIGGAIADFVGDQLSGAAEAIGDRVYGVLERLAPQLVPILRRGPEGVLDWVKERVNGAVQGLVDGAMGPVRTLAGIGRSLHAHVDPFLGWMREAAERIGRNDCKPISEAAARIEDVATRAIEPIVARVQELAGRVGSFFSGLWEQFGVPVWQFIQRHARAQWDMLQQLGDWIWNRTARIRNLAGRAWTWIKNRLGIGEGPEGQDGILQWVQGKARQAWDAIQARIAPYRSQINTALAVAGGIALLASPAGPLVLAGAAVVGLVQGVRWLRANLGHGDAIVRARAHAQTVLIPQALGAIRGATAAITRMAASVSGRLGEFSASMGRLVGAAASTAMHFLVDAAQWLADKAVELAAWATGKLGALAEWFETALGRLRQFLQPLPDFLGRVGALLLDIYGLPLLLAGRVWNAIPPCIRNPFIDWIVPLVLRQIAIFQELVRDNDAWQRTRADVMNIVRMVFVTKDLRGALNATFALILRVFNLPPELLAQVWRKVRSAWDTVMSAPVSFLRNMMRTVGRALLIYGGRLRDNLLFGLEGWLFREVAAQGIARPNSWTNPWDVAQFVMSVLGLSVSHVIDLIVERLQLRPETATRLRAWYARLSRAWDWIMEMRGRSPGEVTQSILQGAGGFALTVMESVVTWIAQRVGAELAKKAAAAAATAGLSGVLEAAQAIYAGIVTAVQWARQIVDLINRGLDATIDIARGVIDPAATVIEGAMRRATPVVIGFLAGLVGLGGAGEAIRDAIRNLRRRVDDVIKTIIDRLRAMFRAITGQGDQSDGTSVKARVAAYLRGRRVGNPDERQSLATQLINQFGREGLQGISFQPRQGTLDQVDVIASASPAERIALLNVNTPEGLQELRSLARAMSPFAGRTSIFVYYDTDRKPFGSRITQRGGGVPGHAEMYLLSSIPSLIDTIRRQRQRGRLLTPSGQPVPIHLEINRTPCDGCAHDRIVPLVINAAALYPDVPIALTISSASVAQGAQITSEPRIIELLSHGVVLTASSVWDAIKDQMVAARIQQLDYRNAQGRGLTITMDDVDRFRYEAGEVQELLDSAARKLNRSRPRTVSSGTGVGGGSSGT